MNEITQICSCKKADPDGFGRCRECGFTTLSSVTRLIPTKPDREVADELKAELIEAAKPYLAAATKAKKLGFIVQSQFGVPNNFSDEIVITHLQLIKAF